jgi:arylsulfatase A
MKLFLLVLFLLCDATLVAAESTKPNILFILTDDQGWSTLGCYGSKQVPTPHLDSLARDGVRFTQAYAMPQCTPTRASLFSGQHTARNGMWHVIPWYGLPWGRVAEPAYREQFPRNAFNLPKGLRAAGYTTGMGGKWHLTSGADGDYTALNPAAGEAYGFDFVAPKGQGQLGEGDKWVDHLTGQAIGFIEQNRERPWFFYLAHHTVHGRVSAPDALVEKYRAKGAPAEGLHNAIYLAALEHLDNSIGRLLAKLDELKLRERTIVIFQSDNGGVKSTYSLPGAAESSTPLKIDRFEFDNAPLRANKGTPYEAGIRVPCLVRWPGVIKGGIVSDTDGDWKLIEYFGDWFDDAGIYHAGQHVELYNLRADVGEAHDLATREPERAARLRDQMHAWLKSIPAPIPGPNAHYDAAKAFTETREKQPWNRGGGSNQ